MTSTISEAALALGRLVELSILGKATIILVIGLTIVMLFRRARASVRHLLLAATLAAVLALPLIVLAVPEVTIGVPASQASESTELIPAAPSVALIAPTITSLPSRAAESAPWSLPSWMTIIRAVWLAGAFLLLAQLAIDLRRLYRIRRDGQPWWKGRELMRSLASECGIRRKVDVLLHEGIPGPITCGIWRPAILLPDEACDWAVQMVQFVKDEKIVKGIVKRTMVKKDGTRQQIDDPPKQGEWRTALSMAKKFGHKDVVNFLLASGARE